MRGVIPMSAVSGANVLAGTVSHVVMGPFPSWGVVSRIGFSLGVTQSAAFRVSFGIGGVGEASAVAWNACWPLVRGASSLINGQNAFLYQAQSGGPPAMQWFPIWYSLQTAVQYVFVACQNTSAVNARLVTGVEVVDREQFGGRPGGGTE